MLVLVLAFGFVSTLSLLPVRGKMCSAMIKAAPGDDLTALREKAFAAFRTECRGKQGNLNDTKSCSFTFEPTRPPVATFKLQPLRAPFRLDFDVKTHYDAVIVFAEEKTETSVFAFISIGGWSGEKSAIRGCFSYDVPECSQLLGGRSEHIEGDIVSGTESRHFWIEFKHGVVTVGKGGQEEAFLEWDAAAYHHRIISTPVYVGISAWGSVASDWVFHQFCE
ncbi:uncharacterized protein LOC119735098 [Patiria miniata]|uniref:Farnesoic acid O-methyl transferase domain-containing protein n=1 Tax=Patiria miniata TaxID=46514 RepID=A0A914AMA8_PATMI|nr:uncharacterized protein LOC119735098 [Patiria miniata]